MMMKVALLLLALAAPMISATGCKWARKKVASGDCGKCSASPRKLQTWAEDCCDACPDLKCPDAWHKLKTCPKKCKKLHKLADRWGCEKPKHGGYGHGGGGDGYERNSCVLYPNGHKYRCEPTCKPYGDGRVYDYGDIPSYQGQCTKNDVGDYIPAAWSYIRDKTTHGYGSGFDYDLCVDGFKENMPMDEYRTYLDKCPGYEPLCKCPTVKPYECPPCETYACPEPNYETYCQKNGYVAKNEYDAATLASSGETTNETVQTLSWVLIAIAAALFLASIAFCAVGRRERKAHAAENVHVNALA